MLIGAANYAGSYHRRFQGIVDEVRLWDHARDEATIFSFMTEKPKSNAPGLLAAYYFTLLDARDESGNGHDGTPEGTVGFPPITDSPYLVHCDGLETANTTGWAMQVPP